IAETSAMAVLKDTIGIKAESVNAVGDFAAAAKLSPTSSNIQQQQQQQQSATINNTTTVSSSTVVPATAVTSNNNNNNNNNSTSSSHSSSAFPKRLHVSNIPFRFRDPDLRQLFGVCWVFFFKKKFIF